MSMPSQPVNHTPVDVRPRRMQFPYANVEQRAFFDNNVLKSAYIAALSATFPAGEAEFIHSVRLHQKQVTDPEMQRQIRGFIGQEAHHSKQHRDFNKVLTTLGFDALGVEKVFEKDLAKSLRGRDARTRLAFTVGFEHQTAILAHEFLTNPNILRGMDDTIASLLRWHAVEEIEHKSVAFDLYMSCVGDRKLLWRTQKLATALFSARTAKYMMLLLWWSKTIPSWRDIRGYYQFMFGKEGLVRRLRGPYGEYFRTDFHPWQHDNRDLVTQWKEKEYQAQYDVAEAG